MRKSSEHPAFAQQLQYDGTFDIATGKNRHEKIWKNSEWLWSDLVKKLAHTHRTAETYSEYISAKKVRQDEIKDIGGFVGGYLNGGSRRANSVVHRQLITLDADFADGDFWSNVEFLGFAAAVYSTHKHSPQQPRFRLVMPLDRPVMADEYQAIARRVAEWVGIDVFDHTTFQANRLMYWPSTASDAEWVFHSLDAEWLCADEILATFHDWRDTSSWPTTSIEGEVVQKEITKQGDPLEKPGLIGAFCRTYTIHQAIEKHLPDVYESCELEDRYTYKEGSTAAGLITYNDVFAYSHHGTDPCSGKLCNAFDLVRIHKFGLLDDDAKPDTAHNRKPSFLAMQDFVASLPDVRILITEEKYNEAQSDFAGLSSVEEMDLQWTKDLVRDGKANVLPTIDNFLLILRNDVFLKKTFGLNLMTGRIELLRNRPWTQTRQANKSLTDTDTNFIEHYIEKVHDLASEKKLQKAISIIANENAFHPVLNYLNSLVWDGHSRIEKVFVDYFGAEDCVYIREVAKKWFAAAATRIFSPGEKFDYVPVLVGREGVNKSMFCRKMAVNPEWFVDDIGSLDNKQALESIQGKWIVEFAELASLRKAEAEHIKQFISKGADYFRPAYGRNVEDRPRQNVFIGTSNNRDFLKDPTGNRRFWPVDVWAAGEPAKSVERDLTREVIDQMWAEAVCLYKAGEPLYLSAPIEEIARQQQASHTEADDRAGIIHEFLNTPLPNEYKDWGIDQRRYYLSSEAEDQTETLILKGPNHYYFRKKVCVAEVWCELFGQQKKDMNRHSTRYIYDVLRKSAEWTENGKHTNVKNYGTQRYFSRTVFSIKRLRNEMEKQAEKLEI